MQLFNRSILVYLLCLFSSIMFSACNSTIGHKASHQPLSQSSIVKSLNDNREYAFITLSNQLEFVLVSDPTIEKSAAALSVGVGSYQEPKAFGGLAHYLEHMLFMGTKSYPAASGYGDFISRNGGTQNAYTDLEHTNYMIAVNNDVIDEALDRFSGFFYEALLDERYADKERNAVHSEWTMKSPNDWVILEQLNGLTLSSKHPVSQFNWGNLDSLSDTKTISLHKALVDFYHQYYSANLMKGVLVSHLPISEMKSLAKKYFEKIPNKNTVLPKLPNVVSNSLSKIIHYIPQTDMKQIQLKFVIENNTDQFAVKPNGYVNYLLANEMPGSLASVLRDAGLSEAVYADFNASMYGDHGDLTLYIDLTEDGVNNRDKVMAAALKYINLLKEHGVNEKYFKEIKQSLKNIFRFKEQSNDFEYAMQIAANLQKVPVEYVLSHEYTYQQFNSNAIQQVLDQLTLDNARIFYIDKEQPAEQAMEHFVGMYSVSNISNKQRQDWSTLGDEFSLFLPRENKLMPSHFDLVPAVHIGKPKQLVNQLGYTSHLGHSRLFEQPKGKINIELNTGLTQQSAKNFVLANVLSKTLNQKMTELQSEAITAGMNVDIDVSNGFSIIISGFSHKQSELLERTLTTISQLTITQSNLLNNIASFESDIRSSKNHILLEQLFPKFRQVLNLDNFSDQAILNELEGITPQQVITFKNELLKQANLQIFAFGNYTAEQVKDMGDLVLKVLPEDRQVSEFYLSPELKASAGEIYTWQEDVSIDDVAFADTYMAPLTVKDLAVAHVLNEIINPALFKQIRTEEQLAYTVGFFSQRIKEQLLLGYYIQSPAKGLADIQERILAFRGDFSNLLNDYSEAEFSAYKNSLLTRIKQPAKNLAEEHSQYLADWRLQNHLFDSEDKLIFQVENVTLKDVIGLYKKIETGQKFGRLLVQLRGANFTDKPYIQPSGGHIINDIESFHHDELEKVK